MGDIRNAAGFVKANMPLGLGGTLTDQQAWDVATFMDNHERPQAPPFHRLAAGHAREMPRHARLDVRTRGERPRARRAMKPCLPKRRGIPDHGCQRYTTRLDPL